MFLLASCPNRMTTWALFATFPPVDNPLILCFSQLPNNICFQSAKVSTVVPHAAPCHLSYLTFRPCKRLSSQTLGPNTDPTSDYLECASSSRSVFRE